MKKERNIIELNTIVVFDRDVKASELNVFTQEFKGDVIITKRLVIDKDIDVSCNLYVIGSIVRKIPFLTESKINIDGDLYCYDEVHCNNINVSGCFYAEKLIYSRDIKVGGDFLCDSKIDAYGCDVVVAGDFECYGITANKVEYLGQISVYGSISVLSEIKSYH